MNNMEFLTTFIYMCLIYSASKLVYFLLLILKTQHEVEESSETESSEESSEDSDTPWVDDEVQQPEYNYEDNNEEEPTNYENEEETNTQNTYEETNDYYPQNNHNEETHAYNQYEEDNTYNQETYNEPSNYYNPLPRPPPGFAPKETDAYSELLQILGDSLKYANDLYEQELDAIDRWFHDCVDNAQQLRTSYNVSPNFTTTICFQYLEKSKMMKLAAKQNYDTVFKIALKDYYNAINNNCYS